MGMIGRGTNMIEVNNISFKYGMKPAGGKKFEVRDASLKLEQGYISCLLGNNGAGKTTLLNLIYGMLKPRSGEVVWNGNKLTGRNMADFRQETAYIGEKWCADGLTVGRNTELLSNLYPAFDRDYYDEIMKLAGMDRVRDTFFGKLSKGEKVKVEIAFALARKPKFIILDEPLANVDPVFKIDILELLQNSVKDNETGVLLSTHLLDEISEMVDFINVMENGKITKSGTRFDLLGDDESKQLRNVLKK